METTVKSEHKSITIAVPMVYMGILFRPAKFIRVEAEGRVISYNSDHYYDFIGRVRINPFGPFFISGVYRYEDIKIAEEDVEADVTFKGPFAEIGVSF